MINTQLSASDLVSYANKSIQAFAKGKAELDTMCVKLVKEKGDEKLEFCLRVIERLVMTMAPASLILAFAVSPWVLVSTPVAIFAFTIIHAYNADRFGVSSLSKDYLPSYRGRLEARGIPTEYGLYPPIKMEELDLKQRVKFFLSEENYVLDAQKIETDCQSHLNTLKAIAHLFSALNQLEPQKSKDLSSTLVKGNNFLRESSLDLKVKEILSQAFDKIKNHSTAIQQKLDEMRIAKTLSKEALMDYIATLPETSSSIGSKSADSCAS